MQAKTKERQEARRLRAEGMSVKGIAKALGVSQGSVSVWVRDVEGPVRPVKERRVGKTMGPLLDAVEEGADDARRCGRCQRLLPLEAFNRNGDGHQHWCRGCFRDYFRDRGQHHRDQSRAGRVRRREAAQAFVLEYLSERWCVDCGEDEILALEFDHAGGEKSEDIARMTGGGRSLNRIRAEIALCEVVCVNCHRRRTAARGGFYRATGVAPDWWTPPQRRNVEYLIGVLRREGCVDCGEHDPVVLDFDHLRDKRENVGRLALACSFAVLQAEIAKCEIRCGNCHRIRTLTSEPCWRADEHHWAAKLHV